MVRAEGFLIDCKGSLEEQLYVGVAALDSV